MPDGQPDVRCLMPPFTRFLLCLLLTIPGPVLIQAADAEKITFYVQLIRGSDSEKPAGAEWKPVGAKLGKNLRAVFRWQNYWEVKREAVTLSPDRVARLQLARDREVEIRLLDPPHTQIRLYHKGKLTRCAHQPIGEHMTILGDESKSGECWFVVLRRDRPLGEH